MIRMPLPPLRAEVAEGVGDVVVTYLFVFLVLASVIGFSAEQFGIVSGLIFGPYEYTDRLQPKLLDVPIVIPLCWFAIVYFAHVLTNLIISGVANLKDREAVEMRTSSVAFVLPCLNYCFQQE